MILRLKFEVENVMVMANIWKVGSRWNENGAKEFSIISVFRRNNVVFVGNSDYILSVKAGDYLAIADGYKVVSIAKAIKDAEKIKNMTIKWSIKDEEWEMLDGFEEYAMGVKVKIVDLKFNDQFDYQLRSSFCQIQQEEVKEKIVKKYENQSKQFSIQSYTCTLLSEQKDENVKAIFDSRTRYIIPVYQRPYSWSEKELEPFINDIFKSFWGVEKNTKNQEPMFIGTMQLSEKKFIDKGESEQFIIDGQQRLSTIIVLMKILLLQFPKNKRIKDILDEIEFETQVGNEQQRYLTELLNLTEFDNNAYNLNPYLRNALFIKNLFSQNVYGEVDEKNVDFPINIFLDYLTTQIYFVIIETYAGLTKTLQIFNAINTTGLDLNGGDIFKIKMYEYLTSEKHEDSTEVFKEIEKLYNLIDEKNKDEGANITIREILEIYQDYLIAKYDLPVVLFDYGVDTFFDRLFDSLLGINQWENFKNLKVELLLDELTDFINVRYEWENEWKKDELSENILTSYFIWESRYGKHWKIVYTLLYLQRNLPYSERYRNCQNFLTTLNKLFFIYSIKFDKAVNLVHTFMNNLKKQIVFDPLENLITRIEEKISSDNNENETNDKLNNDIVYNARKKGLVCKLSAYLNERDKNISVKDMVEKLFESRIDIEHIQSYLDNNGEKREEILNEWGDDINSIGNLMVLEENINRSIGNAPYKQKLPRYKESKYEIVQLQANKYQFWDLDKCRERKQNEIDKILNYLFNDRIGVIE